jgi:hypothetical protein
MTLHMRTRHLVRSRCVLCMQRRERQLIWLRRLEKMNMLLTLDRHFVVLPVFFFLVQPWPFVGLSTIHKRIHL